MNREDMFHSGEIEIQNQAGEQEVAALTGRIIQKTINSRAADFISGQSFVVVASLDEEFYPWASFLWGSKGLVSVKTPKSILIHKDKMLQTPSNEFRNNLTKNTEVASLFIDFRSKKRHRVNGTMTENMDSLSLCVEESYPNCPRYIQSKETPGVKKTDCFDESRKTTEHGTKLDAGHREMIRGADTFFVATFRSGSGMDISHRGGEKGFVQIMENGVLRVPDYQGNGMFNTLGNMHVHPRAGLLFFDFEQGELLQLIGETEIHFNRVDTYERTGGTNRIWDFRIHRWVHTKLEKHQP